MELTKQRDYYQQIKEYGLSTLHIYRILKEAKIYSTDNNVFNQRTLQNYFNSDFSSEKQTTQDNMNIVLQVVDVILKHNRKLINNIKEEIYK